LEALAHPNLAERPARPNFVGHLNWTCYKKIIQAQLRDPDVRKSMRKAFEEHNDLDLYTEYPSDVLLALREDYEANSWQVQIDDDPVPPAFKNREPNATNAQKSFLEVDHILDVQMWVTAVLMTVRLLNNVPLSLAYTTFLNELINSPVNLNTTTWKINSIGKNKLVTKFLDKWDLVGDGTAVLAMSADNIMQIELSGVNRNLLGDLIKRQQDGNATTVNVQQNIGRAMCATMLKLRTKLWLPSGDGGEWKKEERLFSRRLASVMAHMCVRMWPELAARGAGTADAED
jgi:hypothetical protein